jgi:hypothetical protein
MGAKAFWLSLHTPQEALEKPPEAPILILEHLFVAPMWLQKSKETLLQEELGKSVKIPNLFASSNVNITSSTNSSLTSHIPS